MAAMRGPRLQVGSAAWIAEERSSALQIAQSEVEEFSYSVRNELDWLNEHMAGIFDENETNLAEAFKTPGKLRGKTPRTARKAQPLEGRVPLSDVFAATPNGSGNRITKQSNRVNSPHIQAKALRGSPSPHKFASPRSRVVPAKSAGLGADTQDSGYHGSQDSHAANQLQSEEIDATQESRYELVAPHTTTTTIPIREDAPRQNILDSPEKTFQTAREDHSARTGFGEDLESPELPRQKYGNGAMALSAQTAVFEATSPNEQLLSEATKAETSPVQTVEAESDDHHSPSEASSPIRPVVRKSSLNFASLPAREPLTAGKSIGARVSRTSHLDLNRKSYYNRQPDGKSMGNHAWQEVAETEDQIEMDVDKENTNHTTNKTENLTLNHTKTYTQRLQDQINMLGQSQANASRQSKSIPNAGTAQPNTAVTAQAPAPAPKSPSPLPKDVMQTTPGAFPDDDEEDEDDWIAPPPNAVDTTISRPQLPKSHTADVMEGIHDKDTVGQTDFARAQENGLLPSSNSAFSSSRQAPAGHGHAKSASVSTVPPMGMKAMYEEGPLLTKAATISNTALDSASVMESSGTPSKSQSRVFRDSPLKQVKNKLSSILKSSRGLLASSAAISAEGKSSMLSPSPSRLALHTFQSTDSILPKPSFDSPSIKATSKFGDRPVSPERAAGRRTRASIEKEKEDKRREKEAKHLAEQMEKLEKAREQEREKARVFSKEQEKIAALEKQVASKKDHEKLLPRETPKPTRSSPRKAKMPEQPVPSSVSQDVEMADAPPTSALPSAARPTGSAQATRNKEIRRPMRPGKEVAAKAKQAPTVIKVNTGSQHSQYHSSANPLPPAQESSVLPPPPVQQPQLSSKASKPALQSKPSTQSLKSSTASMSRPKALDLAAKKKEQEEKEAQRRRDAKAEADRKKAVAQEEQRRQEQQRRQDADRQKQKERDQTSQTEAKKSAQRQAAIEKAKQTRAPPPAVRSQPNGPPDFTLHPDKGASSQVPSRMDASQSRPQSRMQSGMYRAPDDGNRPANAGTNNAAKASSKRTLPADAADDLQAKRPPSRGGPTYQAKDAKRRRTSENHQNDLDGSQPPNIKGPPVRPSGAFKKELPKKSIFQNGYTNAPQSASRDLFKAAVTAQQPGQAKPAHPLDMAQISKGAIPFAPTANAAANAHKTPARPGPYNGAKSAAKSVPRTSPRFQNGESIELPEIQTDDEDEDDDEAQGMNIAAWADSPDLRRALMRQETMDPSQIFGPPKALNMEEVFSKNKDRWHKFRARTSSANWSGSDRLTEEDIRKDLAARDKLRREGAWSYEMSKELI